MKKNNLQTNIYSDFHIHSNSSDGFWTPSEVILQAKKKGLKQISITDHNTVSGLNEAETQAKISNIDLVCGVEINAASYYKNEFFQNHILAYNFNKNKLQKFLKKVVRVHNVLFEELISNLKKILNSNSLKDINSRHSGIIFKKDISVKNINKFVIIRDELKRIYSKEVNEDEVTKLLTEKIFPPETIARFIKNNLLEDSLALTNAEPRFWSKIIFNTIPEVFDIVNDKKYYVTHKEVLDAVIASEGTVVLAHPFLESSRYNPKKLTSYYEFIGELIKNNLKGMEIYYYVGQGFSENEQEKFNNLTKAICIKNDLLMTFGSDCHGPKRNDESKIFLGKFGSNTKLF